MTRPPEKLGTVEEPPAIRLGARRRAPEGSRPDGSRARSRRWRCCTRGSTREFTYDAAAGRFTPKNALGIAGETLDALHEAKDEAKKSGMYKKMQSGDPNDIFDAAEQFGKVFEGLAKVLAPKRILPTYKMLIESAKPPLPEDAKALALEVAESPQRWSALLKRPFWTLKPDGPFIYEQAEVTAIVTDRLASLGDPPTRLRLKLVRFRLEGIDTGWKVVSAASHPAGRRERPSRRNRPRRHSLRHPRPIRASQDTATAIAGRSSRGEVSAHGRFFGWNSPSRDR